MAIRNSRPSVIRSCKESAVIGHSCLILEAHLPCRAVKAIAEGMEGSLLCSRQSAKQLDVVCHAVDCAMFYREMTRRVQRSEG